MTAHILKGDYIAATALIACLAGAVATFLHVLRLIWPGRR